MRSRSAARYFLVNLFRGRYVDSVIRLEMQLKNYFSVFPLVLLGLAGCASSAAAESNPMQILNNAPLRFEPTASSNAPAAFIARGARYRFEFLPNQAVLSSGKKNVHLTFYGGNRAAKLQGRERLGSTTNLYFGNDPSKWRRAIPNYGRLQVEELYRGIDLTYYGNGSQLEYDLTVKPGADPSAIRLRLDQNGRKVALNRGGDLVSELTQKRPVAYQIAADGSRHAIASSYRKNGDGSYGFRLGDYDRSRALVIDPTLIVAQYFAGSYQNIAYGLGHDASGKVYIGGTTQSTDLPLVGSSYQTTEGGGQDLFLAIVNPALSGSAQVIYVTYLGGTGDETFGAMAVDDGGDVFMTGSTLSDNFPMENAAQSTISANGDPDAYIVKFNSSQSLVFSTFYGGSDLDNGTAISVASNGWIWVAGDTQSTDLPNATGGFQTTLIGTQNMFVAGFDTSNSGSATEIYSAYIGGTHYDEAYGIAAAPDGTVWIAGETFSPDIWIQGNPYQGLYGGDGDGYIAHLNPGLGKNALLYASFLGGSQTDAITSLVLDPSGNIIVSGYTLSSNFPVTSSAYQTKYGGDTDAFITVLDTASAKLVYSTYFGGTSADAAMDLKEDALGIIYVAGYTESAGLPSTSNALQAAWDGSVDAFGLKIDPTKSGTASIQYFTYLGSDGEQVAYGVDFDSKGDLYLAGYSTSNILSRLGGPDRPTITGNSDAFVIGFPAVASTPAAVSSPDPGTHLHLPRPISPHR
jgi:hypothetical protein